MMKVGIVGMPNAGKSSLFNALSQAGAQAANYPFTTIEPNVAVVGCAYLTSSSIKWSIGRARPVVEDLPHLMATPTGLSFPSSHSTSSFAAARAFTGLLPAGPLYCAATAMALSRLYLGVHYPSDVAAGAGLGTLLGSFGR